MTHLLSLDSQALLLLSEPLLGGEKGARSQREGSGSEPELLTPGECRKLILCLEQTGQRPADLLNDERAALPEEVDPGIDLNRLRRLLGRRSALNRAVDRWRDYGFWVVSPFDDYYPYRFRERVGVKGPLVCYGCGDPSQLSRERCSPSLAVVGPRDADPAQFVAAREAGALAGAAGIAVVSGGARGVDQAAMRGALQCGGWAIGVLADRLSRMATQPEPRGWIEDGQLTLVSTRDPLAGFSVGYAMQRNKLIYALADAALVVGAKHRRGGTWAGAKEQLRQHRYGPVYVWDDGCPDIARDALLEMGAVVWPAPSSTTALRKLVSAAADPTLPSPGSAV